jgi:hypothetical protein
MSDTVMFVSAILVFCLILFLFVMGNDNIDKRTQLKCYTDIAKQMPELELEMAVKICNQEKP